jgi:hypothetical protein
VALPFRRQAVELELFVGDDSCQGPFPVGFVDFYLAPLGDDSCQGPFPVGFVAPLTCCWGVPQLGRLVHVGLRHARQLDDALA